MGLDAGEGGVWCEELTQDTWKQEHRRQTEHSRFQKDANAAWRSWQDRGPSGITAPLSGPGVCTPPGPRPARALPAHRQRRWHRCPTNAQAAGPLPAAQGASRLAGAMPSTWDSGPGTPRDTVLTLNPQEANKLRFGRPEATAKQTLLALGTPGSLWGPFADFPGFPGETAVARCAGHLLCWLGIAHSVELHGFRELKASYLYFF